MILIIYQTSAEKQVNPTLAWEYQAQAWS